MIGNISDPGQDPSVHVRVVRCGRNFTLAYHEAFVFEVCRTCIISILALSRRAFSVNVTALFCRRLTNSSDG